MTYDLGITPKASQPKRQRLDPKITPEQIVHAIQQIKIDRWDKENDSIKYDLIYKGERYPPKIVVKYANKYANGELLDVSTFTGAEATTNKFFRERGFDIVLKKKEEPNIENFQLSYELTLKKYQEHSQACKSSQ